MGNVCCCCCKRAETESQIQKEEQDVIFTVYSSSISPENTENEMIEINAARIAQIVDGQIQAGKSEGFSIPIEKDKSNVNDTIISFSEHKIIEQDATQEDGQTVSFRKSTGIIIKPENLESNELNPTKRFLDPEDGGDLSSLHIANLSYKVRKLIQNTIKAQNNGWNMPGKKKKEFDLIKLHCKSAKYQYIQRKFLDGNQRRVRATNICRIENAYLLCSYLLKKEELLSRYGNVHEQILFHGTSDDNITGIAVLLHESHINPKFVSFMISKEGNNFDWRLCENSKFGNGVYFATNSYYASHYPQWADSTEKVMIVAYVLVCRPQTFPTKGNHNHVTVPQPGHDSTRNWNGQVLVKFDDNEFYPAYVVWYENIR